MEHNEKYLKDYFGIECRLQRKRPISKEKMETKDLADKYWMGGTPAVDDQRHSSIKGSGGSA